MDGVETHFFTMAFRIKFLEGDGNAFQELFASMMEYAHPGDFQKVRPYGNKGDLKCDGYLSSAKKVFQCYAPREIREAAAIQKINKDFKGAVEHWANKMLAWVFVHNDHTGLPPGVVLHLEELKAENSGHEIAHWTWPTLMEVFGRLSRSHLEQLFGRQPTAADFDRLGFKELQIVLQAIMVTKPEPEPVIKVPSLEKIAYNKLSPETASFLALGRQRERAVQDFLERWPDPGLADQIAQTFRSKYRSLQDVGLDNENIFIKLMQFAGFNQGSGSSHNAAVLAVLSYFFERCEIFEDPNGVVISS